MTQPLEYVGPGVSAANDLSYRAYVTQKMADNLSPESIDAAINEALSPYVTKSYVDTRDALNATQAYIQQQDNLRLKLVQKNANNGVAALDSSGRVAANRISSASMQRYPRAFWSPASYHTSPVLLSSSTETQIYTCGITSPGYNYKILVFGTVDGLSAIDGNYPIVSVRVGAGVAGPVIARGQGITDSYNYWAADSFNRTTSAGLGAGLYEEVYEGAAQGNVYLDGSSARWDVQGVGFSKHGIFRKIGAGQTTYDDWQELTLQFSRNSEPVTIGGQPGRVYGYLRMSDDRQQYVYFRAARGSAEYGYATSGTEIPIDNWVDTLADTTQWNIRAGASSGNKRLFEFRKDGVLLKTWNDTGALSRMGSNNRGWGFGMKPGASEFAGAFYDQQEPARLNWITMNDLVPGADGSSYGPINLKPVNLHSQSVYSGAQTLTITVNRASTASDIALTTFRPTLYVMAVQA